MEPRRPHRDRDRRPRAVKQELHVCPRCGSGLVERQASEPPCAESAELALRCPECEWRDAGVFDPTLVRRFEAQLARGAGALAADLHLLTCANMAEQVERFVAALRDDNILPIDF